MHHQSQLSEDAQKRMEEEAKRRDFGPTGKFPEGKLTPNDEGELHFGCTHLEGKVVLNFGTPVASLGLSPTQARQLARSILKHANKAERGK